MRAGGRGIIRKGRFLRLFTPKWLEGHRYISPSLWLKGFLLFCIIATLELTLPGISLRFVSLDQGFLCFVLVLVTNNRKPL